VIFPAVEHYCLLLLASLAATGRLSRVSKSAKQWAGESPELSFQFSPDAQGFSELRSESTNPLCVTVNIAAALIALILSSTDSNLRVS
jgi:hypothetical protein